MLLRTIIKIKQSYVKSPIIRFLPVAKNIKLITFDKKLESDIIKFINYNDYIKNIVLSDELKKIIIQNIVVKNKVDFFLKR